MTRNETAQIIESWLVDEYWYVKSKWGEERAADDQKLVEEGPGIDGHWGIAITMYMHRAKVLGLDNPLGRQALMKGLATYFAMAQSMILMYGEPPAGGYASGEIQ